MKIFTGTCYSD